MNQTKTIERLSWTIISIATILFIASFFTVCYPDRLESIARIGDINGGVAGSLWALGGVLLFYAALKSQQSSLEIQRREFELQRDELKEARRISSEQIKTMQQQRFENTFFHLLKSHKENLEALKLKPSNDNITGRFALENLLSSFKVTYLSDNKPKDAHSVANDFIQFCNEHDHVLNTFSNNVFRTLQMIDALDGENKDLYVNLFIAQLSHLEKEILFYKGLLGGEKNVLKPLLEKFHALKLLDNNKLLNPDHWKLYNSSAFSN